MSYNISNHIQVSFSDLRIGCGLIDDAEVRHRELSSPHAMRMPTYNLKMRDNFYYGDEPGNMHLMLRSKSQTIAWINTMISERYTNPANYPYAVPGDPSAEQSHIDRREQRTYLGKVIPKAAI